MIQLSLIKAIDDAIRRIMANNINNSNNPNDYSNNNSNVIGE